MNETSAQRGGDDAITGTHVAADSHLPPIVYVRPSSGGIYDYSEVVLTILRTQHPCARIAVVTADSRNRSRTEARRLRTAIEAHPGIVLAELGSGDIAMFRALRELVRRRRAILTIHDPGVVVRLLSIQALARAPWPFPILEWYVGEAFRGLFGSRVIRDVLGCASARVVLNESIRTIDDLPLTYLPQPVYEPEPIPYRPPARPKFAFCGYWHPGKGLDELLGAYEQLLPRFPQATFVIAGGAPHPRDAYDGSLRARARALGPRVELPGFIPPQEFGTFLRSLSALILPYSAGVPGAASAMLMRAQERGVPLIISNTPNLRTQVDEQNVTVVSPDRRALAAAIADHLDNPTKYAALARTEQERIYAKHSHAIVGAQLARILESPPA